MDTPRATGPITRVNVVHLRHMMAANSLGTVRLAELVGCHPRQISRCLSPGRVYYDILDRVAVALGCHVTELCLDDPIAGEGRL